MAVNADSVLVDGVSADSVNVFVMALHRAECQRIGPVKGPEIDSRWARSHQRSMEGESVFFAITNEFVLVNVEADEESTIATVEYTHMVGLECKSEDEARALISGDEWLSTVMLMVHPLVRARLLSDLSDMDLPNRPLPLLLSEDIDSVDLDAEPPSGT